MVSNLKKAAALALLSLGLSSCFYQPETPQPFPNLAFYQGAYRFSFGFEKEPFITSVPGKDGERIAIASIKDDFYSSRGFLLYACSLESDPEAYFLYKYNYEKKDSEFVAELSPRRDPFFFDLDNPYSPGFFVWGNDGDSDYAFLGENGEVISWEGEDYPYYACPWGYATSLRAPWNEAEFGVNGRDEHNVFHFFDGTEVPVDNGGRVVSADEDKVLIWGTRSNNWLVQYDKPTGKKTYFEGDYSRAAPDRSISSSSHRTYSPFLWKHDFETKEVTIVSFANGEFEERVFSYAPSRYSGVDHCYWVVSTDTFLIMADHACLGIDFALGTIRELPSATSKLTNAFSVSPFDRTIYKSDRYELIERYWPVRQASYYVRFSGSDDLALVQPRGTSLLFFQAVEEVGS